MKGLTQLLQHYDLLCRSTDRSFSQFMAFTIITLRGKQTLDASTSSDEIDLFELINDLCIYRYGLFCALLLGALIGYLAFFFSPKEYSVVGQLKVPDHSYFHTLNSTINRINLITNNTVRRSSNTIPLTPVKELSPATMIADIERLTSHRTLLRRFYDDLVSAHVGQNYFRLSNINTNDGQLMREYLVDEQLSEEENFRNFLKRIEIGNRPAEDSLEFVNHDTAITVRFTFSESMLAAKILNAYGELIRQEYEEKIKINITNEVELLLSKMRWSIEVLRSNYTADIQQRLLTLKESAQIAAEIGQEIPIFQQSNVVLNSAIPKYMLGHEALSAELDQLVSRPKNSPTASELTLTSALDQPDNEDDYNAQIPILRWSIQQLQDINWQWPEFGFLVWERRAIPTRQSDGVQLPVMLFLSMMLSIIMAIVVILFRISWRRWRAAKQKQSSQLSEVVEAIPERSIAWR